MSSFTRIIHQTTNILNSKPLHFITFSLLFLPLTIFTTTTIQLHFMTTFADITFKTLISSLFIIPSSVTATTALITYTTHKIIHPTETTPLTFISTIKSSFFPLLSTILAETLLLSPFALATLLSFTHVTESVSNAVKFCYLVFLLVYFKGGFGIAAPISVLESKYGFTSLWKSQNQLVGLLRKHVCFIFINVVWLIGVLLWAVVDFQDSKYIMFKWVYAVEVCAVNLLCCLMILQYVVANVVLYEIACGREEDVVKTVEGNGNEGLGYNVVLYLLFVVLLAHWLSSPNFWCSWC
ncbi:hypothetical protein CTI12_AA587660 [Artemisia annua]|uniref:Transmembrane protein n=1 Tax=Artemisia annua TaxID=35608 RepID=A0A2U1KM95_ARTAN|nr:hypothetical protein CTI12_AA587660 [Artemisia annua]